MLSQNSNWGKIGPTAREAEKVSNKKRGAWAGECYAHVDDGGIDDDPRITSSVTLSRGSAKI